MDNSELTVHCFSYLQSLELHGDTRTISLDIFITFYMKYGTQLFWIISLSTDCHPKGVPQGCALAPTWFPLQTNGILSSTVTSNYSYTHSYTLYAGLQYMKQPPTTKLDYMSRSSSKFSLEDYQKILVWFMKIWLYLWPVRPRL